MARGEHMKSVAEYITEKEKRDFCRNCNEICSGHCAIWRKASQRYDADNLHGANLTLNKRYGVGVLMTAAGAILAGGIVSAIIFGIGFVLVVSSYINVNS